MSEVITTTVLEATKATLNSLLSDQDVPMEEVCYGACKAAQIDNWNYFVLRRFVRTKSSNRVDYETFYKVHIVHENYIPEGYIDKVIEALKNQPKGAKLKVTDDDITFDYVFKGNTDVIVEIATITLVHPEKRGTECQTGSN